MFHNTGKNTNVTAPPENARLNEKKKKFARYFRFHHDPELRDKLERQYTTLLQQVMDLQKMVDEMQDELEKLEEQTFRRTGVRVLSKCKFKEKISRIFPEQDRS